MSPSAMNLPVGRSDEIFIMANTMSTQLEQKQGIKTLLSLGLGIFGIGLAAVAIFALTQSSTFNTTCTAVVSNNAVPSTTTADEVRARTTKLKSGLLDYQRKPSSDRQKKVRTFAQARKQAIGAALMVGRELPAESVVSASERSILDQVTKNCLEQPFHKQGELKKVHADNFDQGTSIDVAMLTSDNVTQTLYPAPWVDAVESGTTIDVTGVTLDNQLFVTASPDIGQLPSAVEIFSPAIQLTKVNSTTENVLTLLANFPTTTATSPTRSESATLFDGPTGVKAYYLENSYNQLTIQADVRDWMTVPNTNATCNGVPSMYDYPGFAEAALNQAKQIDPSIILTNYSRLVVVAPYTCAWGGIANGTQTFTIGNTTVTYKVELVKNTAASVDVISHEFGHDLSIPSLQHANFRNCIGLIATPCNTSEYGDPYDVMGGALSGQTRNNPSHFSAYHKVEAGWLDASDVLTVPEVAGTYHYTLRPIEIIPDVNFPNRKATVIMRRATDPPVYIEYRQPIGFDSRMVPAAIGDVFSGALIHEGKDLVNFTGGAYSAGDNTLGVGQSLIDPAACNGPACTTITVTSLSAAELGIDVVIAKDVVAPRVALVGPTQDSQVQGQITVTATAQDDAGIQRVDFYTNFNNQIFATDTVPDVAGQFSVTLDTTRIPNGVSYLYVRAYDQFGNVGQSQPFTKITVTNTDPTPPSDVTLNAPAAGAFVGRPATFTATATDNVGIWKIEFVIPSLCGGAGGCPADTQPPFSLPIVMGAGPQTVYARAYDFVGNTLDTATINFTVDYTPPTVAMTAPATNSTVSGITVLAATATDTNGINRVEFYRDTNTLLGTDTTSPYTYSWQTQTVGNGLHTLFVKAYDRAGNVTSSDPNQAFPNPVRVTVSNSGGSDGDVPPIIRPVLR